MKKQELSIILVLMVALFGYFMFTIGHQHPVIKTVTVQAQQPTAASEASQKPQIDYVNAIRVQHGLPALKADSRLDVSSKAKADDLIAGQYWDHTNSIGRPFYSWIYEQIPTLHTSGENLGKCYQGDEDQLFQAFANSPEHLDNIINPNYTIFGSAIEWDNTRHCEIFVDQFGGF